MMDEHSRINRTGFSELGNIRDEQNEDDDEFFAGAADEPEDNDNDRGGVDENEEPRTTMKNGESEQRMVRRRQSDDFGSGAGSKIRSELQPVSRNIFSSVASFDVNSSSSAAPMADPISCLPSQRYATNLSRITEMPDAEFSFSFKHGENALQTINENHEQNIRENHLRLPDGTFHASQYSMIYSWEESALRLPNSINRSELNLSHIQVSTKMGDETTNDTVLNKQKEKTTTSFAANSCSNYHYPKNLSPLSSLMSNKQIVADRTNQSSSNFNKTHSSTSKTPPFISGNRYAIYFGFRRLGVNSEEILILRNIHPDGERLRIRCWVKGGTASNSSTLPIDKNNNGTRFKVVYPQEKNRILDWDSFQKVVISFTPNAVDHFLNFLYVECQSRHAMQKFKFLLHGFGGSAIVQPSLEDQSTSSMFLSANGRHQLMVNSLSKFRFWLHNQGNRCAFASIFIYGRRGELLLNRDTIVNTRNVILDKNNQGEFKRAIEVRYLGTRSNQSTPRPSSQSSVAFASTGMATMREEPPMQIIVFWGEERQRQRLKQFEKKLGGQLLTFGRNFTKMVDFYGEGEQWKQGDVEKYTSEEEFYYFDRNVKLIIIDVHEKKPLERSMTPINSANSTNTGQQQHPQRRTGSTLSVVSSSAAGGRIYRPDQVVVEVDPDNTLLPGTNEEDDTLI